MSSESDSALSVGSSGDESDIRVESDEELLNDDAVERKEKPSQEKHKRSYDSRYAVPTLEERQLMRDAEMQVELSNVGTGSGLLGRSSSLSRQTSTWKVSSWTTPVRKR